MLFNKLNFWVFTFRYGIRLIGKSYKLSHFWF